MRRGRESDALISLYLNILCGALGVWNSQVVRVREGALFLVCLEVIWGADLLSEILPVNLGYLF